jgi:hypothetical protein
MTAFGQKPTFASEYERLEAAIRNVRLSAARRHPPKPKLYIFRMALLVAVLAIVKGLCAKEVIVTQCFNVAVAL